MEQNRAMNNSVAQMVSIYHLLKLDIFDNNGSYTNVYMCTSKCDK